MDEYNHTNREGQDPHQGQYTPAPPGNYSNYPQKPVYNYQNNVDSKEGQGFGIASVVIGALSLLGCCIIPFIGIIPGAAAIILGAIGIKYPAAKGMCIAGIILGSIGGIMALGMTMFITMGVMLEL